MDFLLRRFVHDVSEFYDLYYHGDMIICNIKALHLEKIKEMFDPKRFENTLNIRTECRAFLSEVQEAVNQECYVF